MCEDHEIRVVVGGGSGGGGRLRGTIHTPALMTRVWGHSVAATQTHNIVIIPETSNNHFTHPFVTKFKIKCLMSTQYSYLKPTQPPTNLLKK